MKKKTLTALAAACLSLVAASVAAQVKIGVIVSATGPAASLGIPEKNTVAMCPKTIGGKSVDYIVQDDGTDTTNAVQVTKKLVSEDNVDAIIGTSSSNADARTASHAALERDNTSAAPTSAPPMEPSRAPKGRATPTMPISRSSPSRCRG